MGTGRPRLTSSVNEALREEHGFSGTGRLPGTQECTAGRSSRVSRRSKHLTLLSHLTANPVHRRRSADAIMDGQWRADIVIGIDFGMTCTGVAYSMGPEWPAPKPIQRWPGLLCSQLRDKVDSTVAYDYDTDRPSAWGFRCNEEDERFEVQSLFKLWMDKTYQHFSEDAPTLEEAHRYYTDYLCFLHQHIHQHFSQSWPRFANMRKDFVFSAPVSWMKNPAILATIESLIRKAGFGRNENERVQVYLSEAEAAAIHASKLSMRSGEVMLVVDAGGSTTDLTVLKVESASQNNVSLAPLTWNEGEWIGSCMIDFNMRMNVRKRLDWVRSHIPGDLDAVALRMVNDKFVSYKCSFGDPNGLDTPKLTMPVPGLPAGFDLPQAGIEDSKLIVTREEVQQLFDDKIDKICALIDRQLQRVMESYARESVSYIVLSGGLGSSPYLQSRIRARYESGAARMLPGHENLRVLVAAEPQLAVVDGLVMSRTQSNRGGPTIYSRRCSPVSYGILSRELYDKYKHQGEEIVEDDFDKKRWAERQIRWMIKQGDIVDADHSIRQKFRMKFAVGKESRSWNAHIVMSTLPAAQLPRSMKGSGAREVCTVEAKLGIRDMERKNKHFWNLSKVYNLAEFEVRTLCSTGLKFEIWKDGVRSKDHDQIEVQWERADRDGPPCIPDAPRMDFVSEQR